MTPQDILENAYAEANTNTGKSNALNPKYKKMIETICSNIQNRACSRFLIAALLAKVHKPSVDIRKQYTQIGDEDAYSGRTYDEQYVSDAVTKHDLPCNQTTAFLTPAFRNRDVVLTPEVNMVGRPTFVYQALLDLLDAIHKGEIEPHAVLVAAFEYLIRIRDERKQALRELIKSLDVERDKTQLAAEAIVTLVTQHLALPNTSRLPVLLVAAAYKTAEECLRESVLPMYAHNAADKQTGALGDLQIAIQDDNKVVTCYEMKDKTVTVGDLDIALQKIADSHAHIDNYVFITTEAIPVEVLEYAKTIYETSGGIELAVLDCISFIRYFLHLFYRLRMAFLNNYQQLVLDEPESAVHQELKEALLVLRKATQNLG